MATRAFREIMCKENIGETRNSGQPIPVGTPVRFVQSVMGNGTSATALSDEEILELSKANENAIIPGRSEYDHYYKIKFVGRFCLNNRCYAVIRPCLCVLDHEGDQTSITTAKFSVMNSITRLITRLKQDEVAYATIYRCENDGRIYEVKTFGDLNELVAYIQSDKRGSVDGVAPMPIERETDISRPVETNVKTDAETWEARYEKAMILANSYEEKYRMAMKELEELRQEYREIRNELSKAQSDREHLQEVVTSIRKLVM